MTVRYQQQGCEQNQKLAGQADPATQHMEEPWHLPKQRMPAFKDRLVHREIADAEDRPVVVAASVGPTGEILEPVGSLSHADCVEIFLDQAIGLKEGGADVLWLETISSPEEYRAAAEAFSHVDLPWVGTMSFDTAGRTMMGVTSRDMVALVNSLPNPPVAFGANCGTGASDLLRTVQGFVNEAPAQAIVAKGNAGIPK